MLALLSTLNICPFSKILYFFFHLFYIFKASLFFIYFSYGIIYLDLFSFQFNALLQMIFILFFEGLYYLTSEFF